MKIETGVMVIKGDKAWGVTYDDGRSTFYGWVNIEGAPIHNPEHVKKCEDVTYKDSYMIDELKKGRLVRVKRVTRVEVMENTGHCIICGLKSTIPQSEFCDNLRCSGRVNK